MFIEKRSNIIKTRHPTGITLAIILLILASLLNRIANFLPGDNFDSASLIVVYGILVLGFLGLAAAFVFFMQRRWGYC